jgi:hypothetical protein
MQKILALCACDSGHEAMCVELANALTTFSFEKKSWEEMISRAEENGLSSLLYKHTKQMGCNIPNTSRRLLQSLYFRNRSSNISRNKAVVEIVKAYEQEGIDVMLIKGIALSNFVYEEIGSRPMRDIDLLVKKSDLKKAEKVLLDLAYTTTECSVIPDDYYHLIPLEKKIGGLPVSIELHHNLLPFSPQYPLWPLEKLYGTSLEIKIGATTARTLSLEDTLHYVYLHGFQAPLTYEPFRLIHVADIVSLVEKYFCDLDWSYIRKETPTLLNSISRFHFLTPWSKQVRTELRFDVKTQPWGVGASFSGWPLRKVKMVRSLHLPLLLKETFVPSRWWLEVYYGYLRGISYWKVRFFYHPRTIWRWGKVYCNACLKGRKKRIKD